MRFPRFTKINKHRQFNYTPRYYDPEKEDLEKRIKRAQKKYGANQNEDESVTAVKERLRENFQRNQTPAFRANPRAAKIRSFIFVMLLAIACVLVFLNAENILRFFVE